MNVHGAVEQGRSDMSDDEARLQVLAHEECLELLRAGGVGRIALMSVCFA